MFAETKANIRADEIIVPFPTIFIAVDQWGQTIWNEQTGEHKLAGFYISELVEMGRHLLAVEAIGWPQKNCLMTDNALATYALKIPESGVEDCESHFDSVEKSVDVQTDMGKEH